MTKTQLNEFADVKGVMGAIRQKAKGIENSHDDREHRIFAQEVEGDLIDLFQYFDQQGDSEKAEALRGLIRQNKAAMRDADKTNANNVVNVLWDKFMQQMEAEEMEEIQSVLESTLARLRKLSGLKD